MNDTGSGRLTVRLRMLSDWHIGTGTAVHGYVDRQVQRDEADGLPFVPAKTLVGVWRDACEVAASALDSGPRGVWHDWVEHLFGSQPAHPAAEGEQQPDPDTPPPRHAALRLHGPLRFPGRLGELLTARPLLHEAVTFIKPGVAIDPATGAAAERMLRYEEVARGGTTLVGTAEIVGLESLDAEQRACLFGLLWSGAVLVEGIGGKRRRGTGRCRLEPTGPGLPADLDELERLTRAPVAPPAQPPAAVPGPDVARGPGAGSGWERATVTLTLTTPLLAHERTVGNLVLGRDHVPGWLLLPAVLSRLGQEAAAVARRGDLVVTPGTIVLNGRGGRPVPRVFAHVKDDAGSIVNRMVEPGRGQLERFRAGYVAADPDETGAVVCPESVLRMHNTVNDEVQRPTEDLGGVYVYQALAAGTELAAEVRVRSGLLEPGWHERLAGSWRLGSSHKDDYGLVGAVASPGPEDLPRPASDSAIERDDLLRVWLLSDTLIRNRRLAPSSGPADLGDVLAHAFAAAGAADVRLEPVNADGAHEMPNAFHIGRTDSWHRGWRQPRPTLLGFAAGSCLTFRLSAGTIGPETLAEVETAGVGERRGEGFGQVSFNDPRLTAAAPAAASADDGGTGERETERDRPDDASTTSVRLLTSEEQGYAEARVIERAAWRAEIRRRSEMLAADPDRPALGPLAGIGVNHLNTVRNLLYRLDEPLETLHRRIDALTARWATNGDAPVAREALRDLLTEEDPVWNLLDLPTGELQITDDAPGRLRRELRAEALRSLVTACLAAYARAEARQPDIEEDQL